MRKFARSVLFLASSLLLAGCGGVEFSDVEDALEKGWKGGFLLKLPPFRMWARYEFLLKAILVIGFLILLAGTVVHLISLLRGVRMDWNWYTIGFLMMVSVILLLVLGFVLFTEARVLLEDKGDSPGPLAHISLRYALSTIGFDVDNLDEEVMEKAVRDAAISLTILLPKLSISWQMFFVSMCVGLTMFSAVTAYERGSAFLGFILGGLLSHSFSFFAYDWVLEILKVISGDTPNIDLNSGIYVGATLFFYAILWFGVPFLGWRYFPSLVGFGVSLFITAGVGSGQSTYYGPSVSDVPGSQDGSGSDLRFGGRGRRSDSDEGRRARQLRDSEGLQDSPRETDEYESSSKFDEDSDSRSREKDGRTRPLEETESAEVSDDSSRSAAFGDDGQMDDAEKASPLRDSEGLQDSPRETDEYESSSKFDEDSDSRSREKDGRTRPLEETESAEVSDDSSRSAASRNKSSDDVSRGKARSLRDSGSGSLSGTVPGRIRRRKSDARKPERTQRGKRPLSEGSLDEPKQTETGKRRFRRKSRRSSSGERKTRVRRLRSAEERENEDE